MTPDEYRHHACGRKTPFSSRGEARHTVRIHQRNLGGGKVTPYRCPFGDHWHIGHATSKAFRRRRAA